LPWHSTLSRTRQLYGIEIFDALFAEVLRLCVEKGMVQGKRQAVDSAYIKANASMDSLVERKVIEDGREYLNKLRENTDIPPQMVDDSRKVSTRPTTYCRK
jgi:Arc/MetJ family transcription regulator